LGEKFTTNHAGQWAGKAYTTIRDHLKALESLGMVESATYQAQRVWCFVAEELPGLSLPTPDQVISAFHPQTPQMPEEDVLEV
jgi:hypothetical protein